MESHTAGHGICYLVMPDFALFVSFYRETHGWWGVEKAEKLKI